MPSLPAILSDSSPAQQSSKVLYGQSWREYYDSVGLGSGALSKLLKSPAHYKFSVEHPAEPSAEQAFGIAVHSAVLEPAKFSQSYAVRARVDGRTAEGKAYNSAWLAENQGKIALDQEEQARVLRCADAISHHPAARRLIEQAIVEVSIYWQDAQYDAPCKARLDILSLGGVSDLKTSRDASREAFSKAILNYDYHVQVAHYWSGHEHCFDRSPEFWYWICVESQDPHLVAVYECGRSTFFVGANRRDEAYSRYRKAVAEGRWGGYSDLIETIEIPEWARRF